MKFKTTSLCALLDKKMHSKTCLFEVFTLSERRKKGNEKIVKNVIGTLISGTIEILRFHNLSISRADFGPL